MMTTVVVFGGAGFLGRRLVRRLVTEGMTVRVAVRHPDPAQIELRSMGFDRFTVVPADVRDQASVAAAIAGANAVVNTVSAYVERGGVTFEAVHVQGAETVAREAVAAGVTRLVLVSGIGADADSGSSYIRARGRGEQVVRQEFPGATIVRPGAMFGPGDALFGTILNLALWFAIHTIFAVTIPVRVWPLTFDAPVLSSLNPWALILTVAAALAIFRLKWGMIPTLASSCAAGVVLHLVGAI